MEQDREWGERVQRGRRNERWLQTEGREYCPDRFDEHQSAGQFTQEPKDGQFRSNMRERRLNADSLLDKAQVRGQEPPIRFS